MKINWRRATPEEIERWHFLCQQEELRMMQATMRGEESTYQPPPNFINCPHGVFIKDESESLQVPAPSDLGDEAVTLRGRYPGQDQTIRNGDWMGPLPDSRYPTYLARVGVGILAWAGIILGGILFAPPHWMPWLSITAACVVLYALFYNERE